MSSFGSQIRKRLAQLHNLHSTMVSINRAQNAKKTGDVSFTFHYGIY